MIYTLFKEKSDTPSDINEHMETLRRISSECDHITEMGVRAMVSTWAFLEGLRERGGKLVSIDIVSPEEYGISINKVKESCAQENVDFTFILGDTLSIDIEETDLLFIDTLHFYSQLTKELARHADKAKKYIALHDTESSPMEMWPAVNEFLQAHPEWVLYEHHPNNNGLTILKRQ